MLLNILVIWQFGASIIEKNKEDRHTFVLNSAKASKAQHGGPALDFSADWLPEYAAASGVKEHQQQGERRADIELHMARSKPGEADAPHGEDKTDGAPDTNRREIGHDIHVPQTCRR